MNKFEIARVLDDIAKYVELSESNRFKSLAFEKASHAISALERDPADMVASGDLLKTPGIGKTTAAVVEEVLRTGSSRYLEELRAKFPPGIFELLRVPKLGLKKVGILHEKLGVGSLDDLEAACKAGRVAKLKGFGEKTQQKILEGIAYARKRETNFLLPIGIDVGEQIREQLADIDAVENAEISGSVRRRLEIIRNVNIVVVTRDPQRVTKALANIVADSETLDASTIKGVARNEVDVLFHLCKPQEFGSTLLRTTGSEEFVAALLERAGDKPAKSEEEIFKRAAVPFVAPERRESADDLRLKSARKLVKLENLRGTFHVHSTFSDGRNTILEMLTAAQQRGFEYVGMSDHSKSAYYAGGLTEEGVKEQQAEIAKQEREVKPMRVFRGTEADILGDGGIDYDDATLAGFDFVVASIHSRFGMEKDEMTERILRALDHPAVTFLGHLTGRKLLTRPGYTMDFDRVFERAGQRGVMIEINGNPNRLDIDWRLVKRALDRGVLFCINPDAHAINEYNALITGTWVARKAGLSPKEIFNTRPVEEVEEYLTLRSRASGDRAGSPRPSRKG